MKISPAEKIKIPGYCVIEGVEHDLIDIDKTVFNGFSIEKARLIYDKTNKYTECVDDVSQILHTIRSRMYKRLKKNHIRAEERFEIEASLNLIKEIMAEVKILKDQDNSRRELLLQRCKNTEIETKE
jgi:hypothetical protein